MQENDSKVKGSSNAVTRYLKKNLGILLALVALMIVFGILTKFKFLASANVINIIRVASLDGIVAFGATLIIIEGGIDLSVGSIMAVSSTYCAYMILNGMSAPLAIIISIILAVAFGCLNGFLVSSTSIPPFIASL